jgi:putative ABC transport system ATP-binding protein
VIELRGVSKTFFKGTAQETRAIRNVSVTVPAGQWVTVIGSNGAGKSTLLRLVAGTVQADRGQVLIGDRDVTYQREYRRAYVIGRLDQDPMASTAPTLSIEQNLAMAMRRGTRRGLRRAVSRERRERMSVELARLGMGLERRLEAPVGTLSGGQRQALAMIMATITEPKALLLDEHVAALDPRAAQAVMETSKQLVTGLGLTCLMVTHNMQFALQYGDRLIVMHNGQVLIDLSADEKAGLDVAGLLDMFHRVSSDEIASDRALLG